MTDDNTEHTKSTASQLIISAQSVFAALGSGHSEYIYHRAMEVECQLNNIFYETKKILPIVYRECTIGYGEADLVAYVNRDITSNSPVVVCEFKALSSDLREQEITQVKNYLRSFNPESCGLLINFPQPGGSKKARDHIDILHIYPDCP